MRLIFHRLGKSITQLRMKHEGKKSRCGLALELRFERLPYWTTAFRDELCVKKFLNWIYYTSRKKKQWFSYENWDTGTGKKMLFNCMLFLARWPNTIRHPNMVHCRSVEFTEFVILHYSSQSKNISCLNLKCFNRGSSQQTRPLHYKDIYGNTKSW